jgi:small subunit ribosomal protein S24e
MSAEKTFSIRTRKFFKNPLLQRRQMIVDVIHPDRANVSKTELREKVAKTLKVNDAQTVVLFGFKTRFGGGKSTGFALVYDTLDVARKMEPKYRLGRMGLTKVTKQPRKQMKERKNKAKKFRGKEKAKALTATKK